MANPIFEFQVEGNKLSIEGSHFGKEVVRLNDEILLTARNFRFGSSHTVDINGTNYTIETNIANPFTGKINCCLLKDGVLITFKFTKAALGDKNKHLSIILLLMFCGLLGYIIPQMGPWAWTSPILFVLCVVTALSGRERIYHVHTKKT